MTCENYQRKLANAREDQEVLALAQSLGWRRCSNCAVSLYMLILVAYIVRRDLRRQVCFRLWLSILLAADTCAVGVDGNFVTSVGVIGTLKRDAVAALGLALCMILYLHEQSLHSNVHTTL